MAKKVRQDDYQEENTKEKELIEKIDELTGDLQRTRADFENYRKRTESDRNSARDHGRANAIMKLLPVIDNIERALAHIPEDLKEHQWVQGIASLAKNLEMSLEDMDLKRIDASEGTDFNPKLHEAIQFDDSSEGEREVIAAELQAGYLLNDRPIRPALVKVKRD